MKLHCSREALVTAVSIAGSVVPSRTTKDILKNLKIEVHGGKAVLIGTDHEVGIRYELAGIESDQPGEALLPARRFATILHELVDQTIDLDATADALKLRSAHSEFDLAAEDPGEFPPVSGFDDEFHLVMPGKTLREMIRRVVFATDTESTRYALGGVLLDAQEDKLTLAATDSRRLAVTQAPCSWSGSGTFENKTPVIPSKAMTLLERSIDDDADVRIAVHANDVVVQAGSSTIYSRLVEGRFPKYADVIPRETPVTIDLVAGPFHAAVRQAQIVTNEESRGVDFVFGSGKLTLKSTVRDIGQSKVELPIGYDGEEIGILFDPRFVADFLKVLGPEQQIRLGLIDSESAAVLRTDESYTYVIMPLARDQGA